EDDQDQQAGNDHDRNGQGQTQGQVSQQGKHRGAPLLLLLLSGAAASMRAVRMRACRRSDPMNYRHAYHAGNHADVVKHVTLARLIALIARKDNPFVYLDSHAGVGLYDLRGDQASRTGEWLEGVGRLWRAADAPALLDDYLGVLRAMNPDGELRHYPGSPELARVLSRAQDRLHLNEKHPED